MDRLNSIISGVFNIREENVQDKLGPNHLAQWDSLSQLALITEIETYYKVTFDIEEIFMMMTIGDIRSMLEKKLEKLGRI